MRTHSTQTTFEVRNQLALQDITTPNVDWKSSTLNIDFEKFKLNFELQPRGSMNTTDTIGNTRI